MKKDTTKEEIIGLISVCFVLLLVISYIDFQNQAYFTWVKNSTVDGYQACRAFEAEKQCIEYAKGETWSPYPFWKALFLIDPNI